MKEQQPKYQQSTEKDPFTNKSLSQIHKEVTKVYRQAINAQRRKNGDSRFSLFDLYSEIANRLPSKLGPAVQDRVVSALKSTNEAESRMGNQVFTALNLKTMLKVAELYLTDDNETNNDLIIRMVTGAVNSLKQTKTIKDVVPIIHNYSHSEGKKFYLSEFGLPLNRIKKSEIREGAIGKILSSIDSIFSDNPNGLNTEKIEENANRLSEEYGISSVMTERYLIHRNRKIKNFDSQQPRSDPSFDHLQTQRRESKVRELVSTLDAKKKFVIKEHYFREKPLEEISDNLGVTYESTRKNRIKAHKLLLKKILDDPEYTILKEGRVITYQSDHETRKIDLEDVKPLD